MKSLENTDKPQWCSRSLTKNAIGPSSVDTHSSQTLCDSCIKDEAASAQCKGKYRTLLVTTGEKITKIMLNCPNKKTAINLVMYRELMQALEEAAKDDSTLTGITGCGDYYCSGNDLNNFVENVHEILKNNGKWMKDFVNHFIDHPKPLVALVNGPAVGVSVTLLGLFDLVYASNKANEMLLFNKKITADEACTQGLVTEVFVDSTFQREVWARLKTYANLPKNSLALSKQSIRCVEKEILHAVNSRECVQLVERFFSDECMNAVTSFFQQKSKL